MNLKEHLEKQTYDKWYQDVECIGFEGYAKSSKSWDNIKDLVDWKDKIVLDIGAFHGYFCFKAEQAGAKMVHGIDKNPQVIATTKLFAKEINSNCKFDVIEANDCYTSDYDIILCLNVFHHITHRDGFLNGMNSGQKMIMEIDKENLSKVEEYCTVLTKKLSHRASAYTGDTPNRLVLLVEKV